MSVDNNNTEIIEIALRDPVAEDRERIANLEAAMSELMTQAQAKDAEAQRLTQTVDSIRQESQQRTRALEATIQQLHADFERHQRSTQVLQRRVTELERSIRHKEQEIARLQAELDAMTRRVCDKERALEQALHELATTKEALRAQIDARDKALAALHKSGFRAVWDAVKSLWRTPPEVDEYGSADGKGQDLDLLAEMFLAQTFAHYDAPAM